jgi:Zn-dependent protease/CBS domain-containing protein
MGDHEPVGPSFNMVANTISPMKSFRVGSAFGIPIKLDLTFLLILPVFAYIIGIQLESLIELLNAQFTVAFDAGVLAASTGTRFGIGLATALGLFFCVVLHEFGHSLVARRYGVHIDSITLWLLGGIAQMQEIPEDWKQEFNIAIAGPIVSVLAGVAAYFAFRTVPDGGFLLEATQFTLAYLAIMNIVLAVFNMLPGFPMDGGRILRALLARNRPHAQATQQAARVGQLFAILLGLFGLLINFNPFLIVLAFFIYIAAASESTRTVMNAAFDGVTVGDVMTPREKLDVVSPKTTVAELVERMFSERHTGYPVMEGDRVAGVVTLDDAREVDAVERDAYHVEDIMSHDIHAVGSDISVMDAFETMQQNGVGRLLVIDGETTAESGRLVGLLSRTDVMTALDIVKSGGSPKRRTTADDATVESLDRERT